MDNIDKVDPTEIYRDFRDYSDENSKVAETYKLNHTHQTYEYVVKMKQIYCSNYNRSNMGIWDAIELSNDIHDESDPDLDLSQSYHFFQTAENIRMHYPDRRDLHLVGLIHDLGKIMLLDNFGGLPQWSVVGDIFPVGCSFSDKIVYSDFFKYNPDSQNTQFNTKYGKYQPYIGFDNINMSWSHDEYLYNVLKNNANCKIPPESLRIIKYHSFYAFHKDNEYHYLANEDDMKLKPMLQLFSQCDLYSKDNNNKLNIDELKHYYIELINEYCPGNFNW